MSRTMNADLEAIASSRFGLPFVNAPMADKTRAVPLQAMGIVGMKSISQNARMFADNKAGDPATSLSAIESCTDRTPVLGRLEAYLNVLPGVVPSR